jgi:hypothetical protein
MRRRHANADDNSDVKRTSPYGTWITNAWRSTPTDEDLRKTYHWESIRVGAAERSMHVDQKRKGRLERLWQASWYSSAEILLPTNEASATKANTKLVLSTSSMFFRQPIFATVHGRRFIWWLSANDFDNGEPPAGTIFLAGHAGIATPSPLETRELQLMAEQGAFPDVGNDVVKLVVCVFGRGNGHSQQRVTLIMPSWDLKIALEAALLESMYTKGD